MEIAFIGLGSNLDNPVQQVCKALEEISALVDVRLICASSLYHSPPMGPQDQPDYINAVAEIATTLPAKVLLEQMQGIERLHGREPADQRWTARPLDLDILLFGQKTINEPKLKIPHPGLYERAFVLYPLQEIAPDLFIPGHGALQDLVKNCDAAGLKILKDTECKKELDS